MISSCALQVLLAAGDTFRAAAAEQLQLWANRSGVDVHAATRENARPDNVLYQAVDKVSPGWQCKHHMKSCTHSSTALHALEAQGAQPIARPCTAPCASLGPVLLLSG